MNATRTSSTTRVATSISDNEWKTKFIKCSVIMIVLTLVGMLLNFITVSIIAFARKLRRQNSTMLLLNLLSSDFCVALGMLIYTTRSLYILKDVTRLDKLLDEQLTHRSSCVCLCYYL